MACGARNLIPHGFEKARADLVKRNDKLDRDQVRGAASS